MECRKCGRKAIAKLPAVEALCRECFLRIFQKRLRKYIRINGLFKKDDCLLIKDKLCFFIVKSIVKDIPLKIYAKANRKVNKIVIPWTMDDEINLYLERFLLNKKIDFSKKIIRLLKPVTDNEVRLFAKLNNLHFKENKKNKDFVQFLDVLEKKYPEVRFSLLKSTMES